MKCGKIIIMDIKRIATLAERTFHSLLFKKGK